jgi:hypothetical protein
LRNKEKTKLNLDWRQLCMVGRWWWQMCRRWCCWMLFWNVSRSLCSWMFYRPEFVEDDVVVVSNPHRMVLRAWSRRCLLFFTEISLLHTHTHTQIYRNEFTQRGVIRKWVFLSSSQSGFEKFRVEDEGLLVLLVCLKQWGVF